MRTFLAFALFLIFSSLCFAQAQRQKAFEINEKLGRGINYGNMFEAPSETEWGNQWKEKYAGMISGLGFNHVRIPIRWEPANRSAVAAPYTINPAFLARIKQVVDSALNNGLYAIINMHHHEALYDQPNEQKERFLSQWKQISEYFKDYPDSLLFEVLNEPHGNLSAEMWNVFFADALAKIREDNPERIVLMGTGEYGGLGGLPKMQIPDDEFIILTVHYYNPFQFTHQGASWVGGDADNWLGTKWNDTETERQIIRDDFAPLLAKSKSENIPIHIGEFGAYEKADMVSRAKWTTFMARYLESLNWSWAYWEWSAGFGIYDKTRDKYHQELVDALLHNEMPEPWRYVGTPVYTSNFQNSTDGWRIQNHSTGFGSISNANGALNVNISNGGTQGWHVQLAKNPFSLTAGKKYRLSFQIKADSERGATTYVGMNKDPWSAYSGYNSFSIADTFATKSFIFTMSTNDNGARIIFDIGNSNANISIKNIVLEEIVLAPPTGILPAKSFETSVYPNPVLNTLNINNLDDFDSYSVLNIFGAVLQSGKLNAYANTVSLEELSAGLYFILLENKKYRHSLKILKN